MSVDGAIAGVFLENKSESEMEALKQGFEKKNADISIKKAGDGFLASTDEIREENGLIVAFSGRLENSLRDSVEQVVHIYRKKGKEFFRSLNGSFRAAVYDKRSNELCVSTDKFGTRTLYCSLKKEGVIFSSHLTPLLCCENITRTIDKRSIAEYFLSSEPSVLSEDRTLVEGVEKLYGGDMIYGATDYSKKSFNGCSRTSKKNISDSEAVAETRRLLQEAAKSVANTYTELPPVMFSGGLDSTYSALLLDEVQEKPVKTFTFGITDEMLGAGEKRAEQLGLQHKSIEFPSEMVTSQEMKMMEEPQPINFFRRTALLPGYNIDRCISGHASEAIFPHSFSYLLSSKIEFFQGKKLRKIAKIVKDSGISRKISKAPLIPEAIKYQIDAISNPNVSSLITYENGRIADKGFSDLFKPDSLYQKYELSESIDDKWSLKETSFKNSDEARAEIWLKILPNVNIASIFRHMEHNSIYMYSPLIEFQSSLPIKQRKNRRILRKAGQDILPETLLQGQLPDRDLIDKEVITYLKRNKTRYLSFAKSFLRREILVKSAAEPYLCPESFEDISRQQMWFMVKVYMLELWIKTIIEGDQN